MKVKLGKVKMGSVISYCRGGVDPPFDIKIRSVIDPIILSDDPELNDRMKRILRKRFVSQIVLYEYKSDRVGRRYNVLRFIVTVGSMILPTLQTIQTDPKVATVDNEIFWAAIGTSLTVMIANGMIQMFAFDKKYVIYHLTVEKMKATGWQWLERSGKYAMNPDGTLADYSDNWAMFWNDLEKIKSLTIGSVYGGDDSSGPPPDLPSTKKKADTNSNDNKSYAESVTDRALSNTTDLRQDLEQSMTRQNDNTNVNVRSGLQDISSIMGVQREEIVGNINTELQDLSSISDLAMNRNTTGIHNVSKTVESKIGYITESVEDVQCKPEKLIPSPVEAAELSSVQQSLLEDAENIAETKIDTLNHIQDGVLQNINNRD